MTNEQKDVISYPLLGHADDGLPIFAATVTMSFTCPECGKKNSHGTGGGLKKGVDEHRLSHCQCWPGGYYLREN